MLPDIASSVDISLTFAVYRHKSDNGFWFCQQFGQFIGDNQIMTFEIPQVCVERFSYYMFALVSIFICTIVWTYNVTANK